MGGWKKDCEVLVYKYDKMTGDSWTKALPACWMECKRGGGWGGVERVKTKRREDEPKESQEFLPKERHEGMINDKKRFKRNFKGRLKDGPNVLVRNSERIGSNLPASETTREKRETSTFGCSTGRPLLIEHRID